METVSTFIGCNFSDIFNSMWMANLNAGKFVILALDINRHDLF